MKTRIFLFIFLLFGYLIKAQNYFTFKTGYGFAALPYLGTANFTTNNGTTTAKTVKLSFGKGVPVYLGFSRVLKNNLWIGVDAGFLFGTKTKFYDNYSYTGGYDNSEYTLRGYTARLVPFMGFMAGDKKLRPYVKAGFIWGFFNRITEKEYDNSSSGGPWGSGNVTTETKGVYKGNMSFGFMSCFGLEIKLGEKISFFTELVYCAQSWAPKKYSMTEYKVNGADKLGTLPVAQTETEFVKEYTVTSGSTNTGVPTKRTKIYFPFNSLGAEAGIRIRL